MNKGFTLVELLVVISIVAVLSGIILFNISEYINKSKDASVRGDLTVLITAGEVYYNKYDSYRNTGNNTDFCDGNANFEKVIVIPSEKNCNVDIDGTAWAACAKLFQDTNIAFCVDSTGREIDMNVSDCDSVRTSCPSTSP